MFAGATFSFSERRRVGEKLMLTTYPKRIAITLLLTVFSGGCVSTSLTSDVDPQTDLLSLESFHVVKFEPDNRGVHQFIANALNNRGKTAVATDERPDEIDAQVLVTYQDKWIWDLTMYMLELNIELRDPRTDYVFATAKSFRTSLARKSPEAMAEEVIGKLFDE